MLLTWSRSLLTAHSVAWRLEAPAQDGGATLGGVPQRPFLSGGPSWRLTIGGLILRSREAILEARRLQTALKQGARPILINPCDCRQAPLAAGESFAGEASPIVATLGAAALRAAVVTLALTDGARPLTGGEQFAVDHPTWGRRMYRVIEVIGGTDEAPQVRIRPVLREAVAADTPADFNRPGCLMRLDGPFVLERATRMGGVYRGEAKFCELERPPTEAGL